MRISTSLKSAAISMVVASTVFTGFTSSADASVSAKQATAKVTAYKTSTPGVVKFCAASKAKGGVLTNVSWGKNPTSQIDNYTMVKPGKCTKAKVHRTKIYWYAANANTYKKITDGWLRNIKLP